MDKKAKKRLEVLKQRRVKLEQLLAGAKQQMDDPNDVVRFQGELDKIREEISTLKAS